MSHKGYMTFGVATNNGVEMAAIKVRCLEDVDLATVKRVQYDGKSM
jgi:hypothetical protein